MLFDELSHFEVKAGIVDEYHHVGLPLHNALATQLHAAQNGGKVQGYLYKTHVGQIAIVYQQFAPYGLHLLAAEIAKLRCSIYLFQGLHQVGSVKVATGFACNQKVFH